MGGGDADAVEGFRREFDRRYIQPEVVAHEQFNLPYNQLDLNLMAHLEAVRKFRRVYVGGLPPSANEQSVATFFNLSMAAVGGNTGGPGDVVLDVSINHERRFAYVEMRLVEEASNAMALDGILFDGVPLAIRRPADYNPSQAAAMGPSMPNRHMDLAAVGLTEGSAQGLEGPGRIFIGGFPDYITEPQLRELLELLGHLRGFDFVKDWQTGNPMGYAFCIYQDLTVTDIACATLNGTGLCSTTLTVRRANQRGAELQSDRESILPQAQQQAQLQAQLNYIHLYGVGVLPTKVVCLIQVVTADELQDDEEYEDIMEDMRTEACRYGNLVNVVIPRPDPSGQPVAGVGKVFLEYADIDSSAKAKRVLHGRRFSGNLVAAVYYSEGKFANGDYDG